MLGLCGCERKHLFISTWRQTGGHYRAEGQAPHSIFNYKITPPTTSSLTFMGWNGSSEKEQAVCLQSYSSHLFNQTSLRRIYHTLPLCSSVAWAYSHWTTRAAPADLKNLIFDIHHTETVEEIEKEIFLFAFLQREDWCQCHVCTLNMKLSKSNKIHLPAPLKCIHRGVICI